MEDDLRPIGSPVGVGRWSVGLAVLAAGLFYAWLASFAFGTYYLTDVGLDRLREQATALVLGATAGLGAVAAFRALTDTPVWSPWLLVGSAPSVVAALNHLGVVG